MREGIDGEEEEIIRLLLLIVLLLFQVKLLKKKKRMKRRRRIEQDKGMMERGEKRTPPLIMVIQLGKYVIGSSWLDNRVSDEVIMVVPVGK
ncbi:transmembrane protein, putative [Medicago truncatula]|uniref:Transmembrane protein, putative n=2 Tax=Medicago truncatula TaxID=3880 RepID=G7I8S5_MEDTR|nr:transmembrane protein, putative [Medicago truncatula]